jgi:formylmethanofuran dehydrogenase subunit E
MQEMPRRKREKVHEGAARAAGGGECSGTSSSRRWRRWQMEVFEQKRKDEARRYQTLQDEKVFRYSEVKIRLAEDAMQ